MSHTAQCVQSEMPGCVAVCQSLVFEKNDVTFLAISIKAQVLDLLQCEGQYLVVP